MPSKYQIIKEMAAQEALSITSNTERFMAFLHTAANNYKYSFQDQLLIHAQRPDATACAEIDTWNKLGRWVNKGTRDIALLVDRDVPYKLRYVFDLSDTNSRAGREVQIWQMQERYLPDVQEALSNSFGEVDAAHDFPGFLMEVAENAVSDNLDDYAAALENVKHGSLLEELDDLNTRQWLRQTLCSSVWFMLLTRCGYDAAEHFSFEDFAHVLDFNTHDTISVLGVASSDIAEMVLREIEVTVRSLQRAEKLQSRTFADRGENRYHEGRTNQGERSNNHESDLYNAGRLFAPESGSAGISQGGQIWNAAAQLPAEPQEGAVHRDDAERQTEPASGGSGQSSQHHAGEADIEDGAGAGRNGGAESQRPDALGGADEQHQGLGGGSGSQGTGLQLSGRNGNFKWDVEFFHQDDEKNELIRTCEKLKDHRVEIAAFFASNPDDKERGNFIKGFFDNTFTEQILSNGQRVGYRAYDDMLHLWRGSYLSREREVYYRWRTVASHIEGMILMDRWLAPGEVFLPTEEMQKQTILRAKTKDGTGFDFPQAAVDYVIAYGNSYENGKFAIYEHFLRNKTPAENIRFLKDSYGVGGHSDAIPGSGLWEDHDSKGIRISRYAGEAAGKAEVLLTWPMVEKRIRELIATDRYLTPDEKKRFPEYVRGKAIPENQEPPITGPKEYKLSLGDSVYLGAQAFELLALGDTEVTLFDPSFPLFHKVLPRQEFFDLLKENPLNDFYLRPVEPIPEAEMPAHAEIPETEPAAQEQNDENPVMVSPEEDNPYLPTEHLPAPAPKPKVKASASVICPEIPSAQRHNYRITNDDLGVGTPSQRYANNVSAIRLLKQLESESRLATPEEQEILSQYVGWGGLADCFDEKHSKYQELKSLLTEEEYAAARESSLTAFYTPPVVIRAIYKAMENMGFRHGNILEPSCGVGSFLGMLPESMQDSQLYGVELDSISGRIAQQLYQKSSIAVQGFEKTDLPDSFFDAAIGNVPFGQFKVPDKQYDKYNFLIHDYFFARTLDKIRPGGIVAFVTSKGTMDKENPAVRKYIAQRADLLGAIRLPNDTFKGAAGTEVSSDILFLQKRDRMVDLEPDWVHLNTDANGNRMNQYFLDNPDMVLGEMKEVSGPFGPELACVPYEGQALEELLTDAIQNIHAEITEYDLEEALDGEEDLSIPALPTVRNFSYAVVEGKLYYRENSRMNPVDVSATAESRIKGLIAIRDSVRQLIEYQTEDYPDHFITDEQAKLNELYDSFSGKYGLINSRANTSAFNADSSYCLLASLEILDDEGNFVRKADMFSKRTIRQKVAIPSVDTASEALALSLGEKARIDMPYMMELTGKTEEQIYQDLTGVIFLDPEASSESPKYLPADEYLSGNVRKKLAVVKKLLPAHPEYQPNVEALERIQPKDLSASEISVRLGATWLPTDVVESFMYELFGTPRYAQWRVKVRYTPLTGEWNVSEKNYDRGNVKAANTYGTERINGYKIIEETLNLKDVRIFDYVYDASGKKTPVLNKKETAIAQGKQEMIKQAFQDWIWKDPSRRERLCKLYNEQFNSIRPREYDGSHLNFVGMNPEITLRPHQVNAIAHILYGGNTLLAHVVGAGKTFEMVAAAMESKRLGLCQKSLFVVPNHLTEQWASEFLQLYPSANILVATKKDFETKNRKKFCGRIATGDYDAIIIGHSQFEKIPMSIGRQKAILQQQIDEVMTGIAQAKRDRAENFTVKQMERTRKQLQVKLEKLNDQSRKDDLVTFEELGVDRIFVDEAHYYKNLAAFSKMRNVGGISQTEAQKSSDLYMKCRYLDEITGGRGVIFATGTPISNSMVEMYTMQKYLQYNTLKEHGLLHFDAWASNFGETVTAIELAPEGSGYRAKTRFSRFYNLPELMAMFKEVADIQTADMLNLPVPKANNHTVALKPSEQQKEMVASLSERAEKVRNKMVDSSVDNMLLITNDGRKLALDQRLMNPMLGESETGKTAACADTVYAIWQKHADTASTQMVFCDLSTPHNDGSFNIYDDLREKLIAKGIPAEQIAYIHSANSEAQKKELFGKVRSGQIRVLLGSTQKMGAGTNVQQRLIALHHIDCPWRPSDLQQREGRIVRQGNMHDEVDIYTYVTENTFDSYLYQLVESKQKFIGQIMTSKSPVRSAEDIDETALSYAEIKALCTGNPYIKEKMDLDIEVQKLRLMKSSHLSQRYALEDQIIKEFPQQIAAYEQVMAGLEADIAHVREHTHPNEDGFSPMVIEGTAHSSKKTAGSAILEVCHNMTSPDPIPLGMYRGFSMQLHFDSMKREFIITLQGQLSYPVALGTDVFGNIQRLDNVIDSFPERLQKCREQLDNVKEQLEAAKVESQAPFPREEELKVKSARLDELNILLNLDKKENEIVDGELADAEEDRPKPDREAR